MTFLRRILSAVVYTTCSPRRVEQSRPDRFSGLAWAVMLLGAAWGLVLIGLWDTLFRLTWPHTLNWVAPAAACSAATVLGPFRQATLALAETLAGRRRWLRWPGLLLLTAAAGVILNYALRSDPDWPTQLPQRWAWLWPRALYRVLLLTPVWGAWSMLILGQFHRPNDRSDPADRQFAACIHPVTTAVALAIPLTASLVYLNFLYPMHFVPPAGALAAALGGGALIVRIRGRLDRQALLATNVLTQLGFLLAYLAVR